jgi:hypothetical protein
VLHQRGPVNPSRAPDASSFRPRYRISLGASAPLLPLRFRSRTFLYHACLECSWVRQGAAAPGNTLLGDLDVEATTSSVQRRRPPSPVRRQTLAGVSTCHLSPASTTSARHHTPGPLGRAGSSVRTTDAQGPDVATLVTLSDRRLAPACRTLCVSRRDRWGILGSGPASHAFSDLPHSNKSSHLAIKLRTAAFLLVADRPIMYSVCMCDRPSVLSSMFRCMQ